MTEEVANQSAEYVGRYLDGQEYVVPGREAIVAWVDGRIEESLAKCEGEEGPDDAFSWFVAGRINPGMMGITDPHRVCALMFLAREAMCTEEGGDSVSVGLLYYDLVQIIGLSGELSDGIQMKL